MLRSEVSNTVEMNMKTVDTDNDTNITDDGGEGHEWYEENILKGDSDVRYDAGRPFMRSFDLII